MRLKEPRRLAAIVLIIYIVVATSLLIDNLVNKQKPQTITGLSSTGRVRINLVSSCNIQLDSGYNFVSFCANLTNQSIRKVLEPLNGEYSFVLRWNRQTQEFDAFSPEAASNPFTTFQQNESYFIVMDQGDHLNIPTTEIGNMNISLTSEYNAPAYPYIFSVNVSRYITPISENVSFVLGWNRTTQEFMVFSPESSDPEFKKINRGEGQFIYLAVAHTTLRYNKTLLQS